MRQFITIGTNAFMELVRQPVFLLLMTASSVFEIFLATPYYFAFGDEPKLVKNSVLAVMLLAGLLGAVVSAAAPPGAGNPPRPPPAGAFQAPGPAPIPLGENFRPRRPPPPPAHADPRA